MILLGIASSPEFPGPIVRPLRLGAAVFALGCALLFVPPLLSERLAFRALVSRGAGAESDLRLARRLDPLSVTPLVTEARIAPSAAASISPLERAVAKEPRSVALQFQLGLAYLQVGRKAEAEATLLRAQQLFPREERIGAALSQARVR